MSRPWFPFYVGDYVRDTARLTTEAHGAYLLLILDYWVNGSPPDDDATLATITKLPLPVWRKRRAAVETFFEIKGGRWTHRRIEKELTAATEKHQKRVEAGGKGGKAKAQAKQNPSNATSLDEALLYQSQSQPPPHSESHSKSRESSTLSEVVDLGEVKKRIDESYEPSDPAIEYAYSLGMKKHDLGSELSKFIASSMATKATSFNIDASFKVWCDRWLEHQRRHGLQPVPNDDEPQSQRAQLFFVVEGTPEWHAHQGYRRERGQRPAPAVDEKDGDRRPTGRRGFWFQWPIPPGYDAATCEKLSGEFDGEANVA